MRICVRCANEAIQREKISIPTVDEVLEELNGSTVFCKLGMNMGFHKVELEEGSRDYGPRSNPSASVESVEGSASDALRVHSG